MTKVCAAHLKKPALIYGQCVGCELDGLRKRVKDQADEIVQLQAQLKAALEGGGSAEVTG